MDKFNFDQVIKKLEQAKSSLPKVLANDTKKFFLASWQKQGWDDGGIKYMETMEFGLVRNLCMSRNHLIRSYPSTVQEIRFFVNLEKGFRWPRIFLYMGALLYWVIGNFFTKHPRILSRADIQKEEPVVRLENSAGGFEYSDAHLHDNDARFVFGFVRTALDNGGIAANYVESLGSKREGEFWNTEARDVISGRQFDIRSRVLINACGPYVEEQNHCTLMNHAS